MTKIIKAPEKLQEGFLIFLSGSVSGDDWRSDLIKKLGDRDIIILNPQRDDWDSSWTETADNPKFREQVEWELSGLERASVIALYFDEASKSPISLLELGLFGHGGKMIVYCPEGFAHKGNVDIVCDRYSIEQAGSMDELVKSILARYSKTSKRKIHDAA